MAENTEEILTYLKVIWNRKWLIIIPTFLCVMGTASYMFFVPPLWEIDCVIQPGKYFMQTGGKIQPVMSNPPKQLAKEVNLGSYKVLIASDLNLDIKSFPKLVARDLKGTDLVQIRVKDNDVEKAKTILFSLFKHLKSDLDNQLNAQNSTLDTKIEIKENKIQNEKLAIKSALNDIKILEAQINLNKAAMKSKEIAKSAIKHEINTNENMLIISEERINNILEEIKSTDKRVKEIEIQGLKALNEEKEAATAMTLLLYLNEVQKNLRYCNELNQDLSNEKVTKENLRLSVNKAEEAIRQIAVQIEKLKIEIDVLKAKINTAKNRIDKIGNQMKVIRNEIDLLTLNRASIVPSKLIKEPMASDDPVFPKMKFGMILSAIFGVIFFVIVALFIDYIERQRNKRQVQDKLSARRNGS